jgi:DedD protein
MNRRRWDTAKAEARKRSRPAAPGAKASPAATKEPAKDHATGDFAVQVFAFSDDKGANSLVNKLKGKGFPAYSEPVNTSRGTLWRVRVGPYVSRETAGAARDKLKVEGYNGIVAAAK